MKNISTKLGITGILFIILGDLNYLIKFIFGGTMNGYDIFYLIAGIVFLGIAGLSLEV